MSRLHKKESKITPSMVGSIIAPGILSFCGVVVETAMNVTFPKLMSEFGVTTNVVQWMTTIYLLVVAMMVPLSAILKKSFHNRTLFFVANVSFIIGVAIDATAKVFSMLLIGRVIQGIGTGIALPLMFNIILERVPKSKIGMMMGLGCCITGIAPAVGPTYGGILNATLGWRFIFIFLLLILLISLIMGGICIKQIYPTKKTNFDELGTGEMFIAFIALIYGFSNLGQKSFINIESAPAIIIGVILGALFVTRFIKKDTPIVDLSILKDNHFLAHLSGYFALQFLTLGLSFILPNYVEDVNHGDSLIAGLLVLPGAALCAIIAPFGGRIMDKHGAKLPILSGLLFCLVAMFLFVSFGAQLDNWMVTSFYILFMICIGISFGNIMTNGLNHLPKNLQVDGNATFTTVQQLSGAIGTSIISAIIAHAQLDGTGSKALLTAIGSTHALWFMLVLFILGSIPLCISLLGPKKRKS